MSIVGKKMGNNSFVDICNDGTVGKVKEALESGADVNSRHSDFTSITCLMSALEGHNEAVITFLLEQPGIQVNLQDMQGWTALHHAAFDFKSRSVIKLLLNFPGIDTEIISKDGYTPREIAINFKNVVFCEEHQMKMEADIEILIDEGGKRTEINAQSRKRKGEEQKHSQTNMWKKIKTVQRRQKAAVEEVMRKNKEKEEEVVRVERWWLDQLDKEYEDKMAALVKEKKEKTLEIAVKVKAKQERQARLNENLLKDLAKEHKVEEVQMMTELWTKVNKEEEEVEREETGQTVPPPPDCPICYETMTPPTRIFQCGAGHLVCGVCKPKLQVTKRILHSIHMKLCGAQCLSSIVYFRSAQADVVCHWEDLLLGWKTILHKSETPSKSSLCRNIQTLK